MKENGRLNRRHFLRFIAGACVAWLAGCVRGKKENAGNLPSMCVLRPEQTEGPFYVDTQLDRSDVRIEPSTGKAKEGIPLMLELHVSQLGSGACQPLEGAIVDIWHCDASGVYSGVKSGMQRVDTSASKFLRGYQHTNANGSVQFTTLVPGWYRGRTTHIHFKIRTRSADGSHYEFTSQLYFDDAFSQLIYTNEAYVRDSLQDTYNSNDGIFQDGGERLLLKPVLAGNQYKAGFDVTLDLADSKTGKADGFSMPRGPRPPATRG